MSPLEYLRADNLERALLWALDERAEPCSGCPLLRITRGR